MFTVFKSLMFWKRYVPYRGRHRSDINGKTDFSGVQFPDHPGPAVISAPRGRMNTKTDRNSEFPKMHRLFSLCVSTGLGSPEKPRET